jgi:hypothetical protein
MGGNLSNFRPTLYVALQHQRAAWGLARISEGKITVIWSRVGGMSAVLCVGAALACFSAPGAAEPSPEPREARAPSPVSRPQPPIAKQKDGTLLIAGRSLRCGRSRHVLDRGLPNLGLAAPGVLVFNPRELSHWSDTVRLFVYHHECGHHKVGGDEMGADCWAVKQGVRDGWLTRESLVQVCRSFGGSPATSTHPSGASRCAQLNRCFATAVVALAKTKTTAEAKTTPASPPPVSSPEDGPKLLQGPSLKRSGMRPSVEAR